jgi:hypothetical protein
MNPDERSESHLASQSGWPVGTGSSAPVYEHGMDDPSSEKDTKDRKTFGLEFGLGPGGMTGDIADDHLAFAIGDADLDLGTDGDLLLRRTPLDEHGMDDPSSEKDTKDRKTFGLEFGLGPGGMTLGIRSQGPPW